MIDHDKANTIIDLLDTVAKMAGYFCVMVLLVGFLLCVYFLTQPKVYIINPPFDPHNMRDPMFHRQEYKPIQNI